MKDWFLEFLTILSYSPKTRRAIIAGSILPVIILVIGNYVLNNFELVGQHKAMEGALVEIFTKRHGSLALGSMVIFYVMAYKFYQKDKKKYHKHF